LVFLGRNNRSAFYLFLEATMKLLLVVLLAASILGISESAPSCQCFPDQSFDSSIAAVTIGAPTETGGFSAPCAPITCNTTVTFTGALSNGYPAGAQISIVQCANVSTTNTVTLVANNQTFSSCRAGVYKFLITYTNVFTFEFKLTSPITFTIVLQPRQQVPPASTTTPAPTTPPYTGPFKPFNPALSRMDLVIGMDNNGANEQYYAYTKEVIHDIVQYFTYSTDFVRLSFMTFDPYSTSGTGPYPLWGHNATTINTYLSSMPFIPGNNSEYFGTLNTYFFDKLPNFPLRNNTERVFIIFTGTDSIFPIPNTIAPTDTLIDKNDIKFIIVNMNTAVLALPDPKKAYPVLSALTGTQSNVAHWFDYQLNQNNAVNILLQWYFNGNALCNVPSNTAQAVTAQLNYSLPLAPTNSSNTALYCNYMNDVRTYVNPSQAPGSGLKVFFTKYDLNNEQDYIRIGLDGKEVSVLTGRFGSAYYCLQGQEVTVTFQSKNSLTYTGYTSEVTAFTDVTVCQQPPSPDAIFIDISKSH
jgi:hypothetical protein